MRQPPNLLRLLRSAIILTVFALPGAAQAAGFALIEHGASGMGNAFAGGSAGAEDATTVYFNPAGMTRLQGTQFTAAAHVISPNTRFDNDGSIMGYLTPGPPGFGLSPIGGGDGGEAGLTGYVPNLYYVRSLTERVKFGLGINVPFGLATEYNDNWVGRYHAIESELHTININPSLAWQATDKLSLGIGLSAQYAKAHLTNAVDGAFLVDFLPDFDVDAPGLLMTSDFEADVEGDDWGWGFNLGLLYEITDSTRVGLAYRSRVKYTLEGEGEFSNTSGGFALPALQGGFGAFIDSDIDADVTLPDTLSVSLYHRINPQVAVMADVTWTNWSLLDKVVINFDRGAQGPSTLPLEWEDTYRVAAGLTYTYNDHWTWRIGAAYDESPTPNAALRTPRIPDSDRGWVTVGFNYRHSNGFSADVGYAHLFVDDARINNTNSTGHTLVGDYESSVDILSAQLNWTF